MLAFGERTRKGSDGQAIRADFGVLVAPFEEDAPIDATLYLSIPATTAAPAAARAAVSVWLVEAPGDGLPVDAALLLVSEMVTNSVRHARIEAGEPLRLRGSLRATTLRLELWDGGTQGIVTPRSPRRDDDGGGFGLDLVTRLSRAWGVDRDAQGTTVWLELPAATDGTV
jgi:serine/threonine-protein kinase RsbW